MLLLLLGLPGKVVRKKRKKNHQILYKFTPSKLRNPSMEGKCFKRVNSKFQDSKGCL